MARLKVLFITGAYPHPERPVQGVFVREHAKAAQLYNDVVVLHCSGRAAGLNGLWSMARESDAGFTAGIPTYRIRERRLPISEMAYLTRLWSVPRAIRQIAEQGFRPDIIHAHIYAVGVPAILSGRLHRRPVVITEHSSEFVRKLLPRTHLWAARLAFARADIVMPVSKSLQKGMEGYGIKARFHVVPNAIDTQLFHPANTLDVGGGAKRMLFVGMLDASHKKGVPYLLQALARLRQQRDDWHLDVIGDGAARRDYEELAARLGIGTQVTFRGIKTKVQIAQHLKACSFFVLPSPYETFGVALIEALAAGKPVVATQSGGPAEIVTEGVGVLVPPGDVPALTAAIDAMLDRWTAYAPASLASYAQQNFSYEAVGRVLNRLYREVLGCVPA